MHIPKTAGTSLNQAFLMAAAQRAIDANGIVVAGGAGGLRRMGRLHPRLPRSDAREGAAMLDDLWGAHRHRLVIGDLVFQVGDHRRIEQGHYFFACSHIPAHRLRLPRGTFTVTALRDPVDRVLSYYRMLLSQRAAGERLPENEHLLGQGFDDFLDRLPASKLLAQLNYFSAGFDVDEACVRVTACDEWFFIEELDDAIRRLALSTGLDLRPQWANRSAVRPTLSSSQLDALRERLQPELRLYERLRALKRDAGVERSASAIEQLSPAELVPA